MSADRIPDRDRPEEDVDAEFARIVAGWDDPEPGDGRVGHDVTPASRPPAAPAPREPSPPEVLPPAIATGPRDYPTVDEPEEGYTPPPPPPIPRGDVPGMLAWAAVIVGPLFLLFAGLFWRSASPVWLGLAVLAFIGGFVALVLRLPTHRDDASGDDGAVV